MTHLLANSDDSRVLEVKLLTGPATWHLLVGNRTDLGLDLIGTTRLPGYLATLLLSDTSGYLFHRGRIPKFIVGGTREREERGLNERILLGLGFALTSLLLSGNGMKFTALVVDIGVD